jgi:hypothetical protein
MNGTGTLENDDLYWELSLFYQICANYLWIVPVVCGIPGNFMSILVANRKHNKNLSPCVYISAMAVADTTFLVGMAWFMPLIQMTIYFIGLGDDIPHLREYIYKYVLFTDSCTVKMLIFVFIGRSWYQQCLRFFSIKSTVQSMCSYHAVHVQSHQQGPTYVGLCELRLAPATAILRLVQILMICIIFTL